MSTHKPIDLQAMDIDQVKAMSPKEIADVFDVNFVGVFTDPTPQEWMAGTTYHIFGTSSALSEQSHKEQMEKGNFIIWGNTKEGHWHILLSCIDGKFIPPGSLTVEQYKPFLSRSDYGGMERVVAEYNTQSRLTDLLKRVIPAELVGQNIEYKLLKKPAKPAYPTGNEVAYLDDYTRELNKIYSLTDILGKKVETVAKGRSIEHYVVGSPLENSEGEDILGHMLMNSAKAGKWQPFIIDVPHLKDTDIKTATEYLKEIEQINPLDTGGMMEAGILFGIARAKHGSFALPTQHDNKVIVVPSQEFVEYIAQKK